ncbi:MAG: ABC-F family ATP-binding cassette domain-containing protein [bacterium]
MIQAKDVYLELGGKTLFDHLTFMFNKDQRIGLVGRNGSGKSTLLKVIAGLQGLDEGVISIEKKKTIAYLPQEVVLLSDKKALDEAMTVFTKIFELKEERAILDTYFDHTPHEQICQEKLDRYAYVQHELADVDVDSLCAQVKKVLSGLGFTQEYMDKPVTELSVGWRMRLVLAKLLLQNADFYLFDEPTNHLDIVAKEWFLHFLKNSDSGFLLVSHDRYFLDHLCDNIYALENGSGKLYSGNYSSFLTRREEDRALQSAAYVAQQKEIKQKQETIERFRAKASKAKMAKSMMKSLDKMEKVEAVHAGPRAFKLNFGNIQRAGHIALTVKNVSKHFGDRLVFKNSSFELMRGDKAAIVASNGVGKTTMLNLIIGKYELETGSVTLGHNVTWSIFEQDQDKLLNPEKQVLEEVESACTTSEARQRVRMLLGSFLFPGDDVYKKIRVLSGGEKNRVAMVKVLLKEANLLILDEPTNHLDIQSQEVLLDALKQFPGTILFVSHDRTFLNGLATKIFELSPAGVASYEGNYDSFLYQKEQKELGLLNFAKNTNDNKNHEQKHGPKHNHKTGDNSARESKSHGNVSAISDENIEQKTGAPRALGDKLVRIQSSKVLTDKEVYERNKRLRSLENQIEKLEVKLVALNEQAETLEFDPQGLQDNMRRVEEAQGSLARIYDEWEKLQN